MAFRDYSGPEYKHRSAGVKRGFHRYGVPQTVYHNWGKRVLDVFFVLLTLPISLPLILGMMGLVALDGRSPIYLQQRLGRAGRVFHMVKIRTMVPGADALLEDHLCQNPAARLEWNETQKLKCDPRITRVGRFLRKTSLDELPQLWNVLVGHMSLVGPRPMMVSQKSLYPGKAYFALRPGITGPWQVSDRNDSTFVDRARFDSGYLASMSFWQDLSLLMRTISVVMRGTGY